jgi:uncharacterized protein (TIGR02145 family)
MHTQFIKLPLLLLCISFALLVTCQKTPTGLDAAGAVRVMIVFNQAQNETGTLPAAGETVKDGNNLGKGENRAYRASSLTKIASTDITNIVIIISGMDPIVVNVSPGETIAKTIEGVPLGQQTVRIDLNNSDGIVYYTQSQTVTVAAGETVSPSFQAEAFIPQNVVISILSPNGGENWALGSIQNITWTTSHPSKEVSISLYKSDAMHQVLTATTSGTGSYSWTVSSALAAGTNYRVRVSSESDVNVYDESDGDFTLSSLPAPTVTIISPNGGENWELGSTHAITWNSSDVSGLVKVELYQGGSMYQAISSGQSNTGSYSWTVSSALAAGTNYRVRVSSESDVNVYDESDGDFTLVSSNTVTDIDGNVYQIIQIGNQEWMAENLKVTHYRDGSAILNVTNQSSWSNTNVGAYCIYNDNASNEVDTYGCLYNNYAVIDARNIAPEGWHVATDDEWIELEMALGMSQSDANAEYFRGTNEGSKLAGHADLWTNGPLENDSEFGSSGFTGVPGGSRSQIIGYDYNGIDDSGNFWTATEIYSGELSFDAWNRRLSFSNSTIGRYRMDRNLGYSVRCVRD